MADLQMEPEILPPSDDRIFKVLLTHPDAKNILIDIVSTIVECKVIDVQIRGNEVPVMDIDEKAERFDINCTIETGDQVDVEMNCYKSVEIREKSETSNQISESFSHNNFINKYTYYLTDLHSSQKSRGKKYFELVKTYQATFCTHTVFSSQPGFVHRFSLRNEDGMLLTNQINMVIIELTKLNDVLKKPVEDLTSFEMWSLFLRYAPDPMHKNLIDDIINVKREIGMAKELLQEISKDEHERARYRSRRMAETDRISDLLTSEEKGRIEGRTEVITLLKQGLTLEEIEKIYAERNSI